MADGRHTATPSRKKPLLIVGALVAAALVAVAVFAMSGGDAGSLGGLVDDVPETPEFEFRSAEPKAVETAAKPNRQAAQTAAQAPARAVTERLDELYTAAFLDPGNWIDGDYDDVVEFFSEDASTSAEDQLDVLTAGPAAGDSFEAIRPLPSSLKLRVLFDGTGVATSVEGTARFTARGTGSAGQVKLVSRGQFIFVKSDGEWLVESFSVRRSDEESEPAVSGSPSSTPGESPDPSAAESS